METLTPFAAVAIMVKTPGFSPVKTRVAESLGEKRALELYRKLLTHTERLMAECTKMGMSLQPYWAIAEKEALQNPLWGNFPTLAQNNGALGDRLHHVYSELVKRHKAVILIGADCPELGIAHLVSTLDALEDESWVIGPSRDGGFYLFAGSQPLDLAFWQSIPYSVSTTRAVLLERLAERGAERPIHLPVLLDIDTAADLAEVSARVPYLSE